MPGDSVEGYVAVMRLDGATMPAAIAGNNAIAVIEKEQHLCIPVAG
jgi:hypothetical protein